MLKMWFALRRKFLGRWGYPVRRRGCWRRGRHRVHFANGRLYCVDCLQSSRAVVPSVVRGEEVL